MTSWWDTLNEVLVEAVEGVLMGEGKWLAMLNLRFDSCT